MKPSRWTITLQNGMQYSIWVKDWYEAIRLAQSRMGFGHGNGWSSPVDTIQKGG